jgi:hypothetical protein
LHILGLDLDPIPHSTKTLDPDPQIMNVDPKHCYSEEKFNRTLFIILGLE